MNMGGVTFGKDTHMASVTTDIFSKAPSATLGGSLVHGLEKLAQLSPTYRRLQALSDTTDAELAARGTTRQDAVRDIFGTRFYA